MGTNSETHSWYYEMIRDLGPPSSKSHICIHFFPWSLENSKEEKAESMKCQRRRIQWIQSTFSQPVLCTSEQHRETEAACTRPVGLWIRWCMRSQLIDTWNEICCFQGHLNGKQSEGCMSISRWTIKNELTAIFGGSFSHNLMMSCQDFSVFAFSILSFILYYLYFSFSPLSNRSSHIWLLT